MFSSVAASCTPRRRDALTQPVCRPQPESVPLVSQYNVLVGLPRLVYSSLGGHLSGGQVWAVTAASFRRIRAGGSSRTRVRAASVRITAASGGRRGAGAAPGTRSGRGRPAPLLRAFPTREAVPWVGPGSDAE